jgi:hypothetical protein
MLYRFAKFVAACTVALLPGESLEAATGSASSDVHLGRSLESGHRILASVAGLLTIVPGRWMCQVPAAHAPGAQA